MNKQSYQKRTRKALIKSLIFIIATPVVAISLFGVSLVEFLLIWAAATLASIYGRQYLECTKEDRAVGLEKDTQY